jgi:thiol-disulfide isomerase/thioredoxin
MLIDVERRALLAVLVVGLAVSAWATARWGTPAIDPVAAEQIALLDGHIIEEEAESFTLTDLAGNPITLSALRGNVIFLNFWASWCPPCREEMPSMMALAESMEGRPFKMVTVSQDEDLGALRAFLQETHTNADDVLVLRDPGGELTRSWGTQLLPETYAIDGDGLVLARFMGARDWSSEASIRLFQVLTRPQ